MGSKRRLSQKELIESLTKKNPDLAELIQERTFQPKEFRPWNLMEFSEIELDNTAQKEEVVLTSPKPSPIINNPVVERTTVIKPLLKEQPPEDAPVVIIKKNLSALPSVEVSKHETYSSPGMESFQSLLPKLVPYLESPQIIWIASAGEKTLAVLDYLYMVSKQDGFVKNIMFTSSGLSREIGVDSNTIRSAIRRLLSENIILAGPSKQGRSGYFSISFTDPIIKALKS